MRAALRPSWLCPGCAKGLRPTRILTGTPARSFTVSSRFNEADGTEERASAKGSDEPPPTKTEPALSSGSRRRRAAIESTANLPFEQLPFQCFQEALSVLRADRAEKVIQIEDQRGRISRLVQKLKTAEETGANTTVLNAIKGGLVLSRKHLETLKVQADINDPLVKKRFEDGLGDMARPVYRHLAEQKWRSYERKIVMQRITQMHVIPDVLAHFDPKIQVRLSFGNKPAAHGVVVLSTTSEAAPKVHIQSFDAAEKLVSVVVVDSDVPDVDTDGFTHRLHGLVTNVRLTPTSGSVDLARPPVGSDIVKPWLPPTSQKGAPWHRLSVWVLEQPQNEKVNVESLKAYCESNNFKLRSLRDKYLLSPIGVTLFRTRWDEGTKAVMERHGIEGADIEYKKAPIEPMRYKKKDGARYR